MPEQEWVPQEIDTSVPSIARVYDFMLGGKDNFSVDRQVAKMALEIAPDAPMTAGANRAFLQRAVRFLTEEAGIRQFLDLGSGLPTQGNVHEVAQQYASDSHVVYVDTDPIVLAHGRALLAADGTTTVVQADIREPEAILNNPEVREFIDFDRPVGLLLFAILHHLNDEEEPAGILRRLVDALPSGSYVVLSHFHNPGTEHPKVAEQSAAAEKLFNERLGTGRWRTREEILAYFHGLELLEPGLVATPLWRPSPADAQQVGRELALNPIHYSFVGGVARKP